jgi:hypothetical protein
MVDQSAIIIITFGIDYDIQFRDWGKRLYHIVNLPIIATKWRPRRLIASDG